MPETILEFLLVFLIVFSCLAHGGVTAFPLTIIELVSGLIVFIWLLVMVYKKSLVFIKTGLFIPAALFLSLIIFQLIPLPLNFIGILSGDTARIYENFYPAARSSTLFPMSIYRNATIAELLKFSAYIGIFFFIINKITTKKQVDILINTIICLGVFISIIGIIQKYTNQWSGIQDPSFGPFANRNNFAGYINMALPLCFGYFLAEIPVGKRVIYGFFAVIMSSAVFLSLSRGGILVCIGSLLFLLFFSRLKDSLRKRTLIISFWVTLAICSFALFTNTKFVFDRLSTLLRKETLVIFGHGYSWWDILRICKDFPLLGTGLGTFGSISPMYKTTLKQVLFTYAHNDYLQMLSEVGLAGSAIIILFFVFYFKAVLRAWMKRHDSYVVCLSLGGIASVFGVLLYSILDFNLHIPANALLFFIILGLVYRLVFINEHNVTVS
jgi:O-antigen ligase